MIVAAFEYDNDHLPTWACILEASREWSMPPWELAKKIDWKWFMRWLTYRNLEIRAIKKPKG